ncbi:MAG: DUF4293 domain-containing protein [Bacteroidetes bacterium]|nr:DUF4293 domain-containing protein [Bacteroidota bacterium]MBL0064326.1 DUF4293 domain-containing protein [Bacteroidota bacterium]MBL0139293.1 DUF4293 domain-containing protein [Bacteroidota bacterium]
MIQRIQSLFLLGVIVLSVLLYFLPVYGFSELAQVSADSAPSGPIKDLTIANNTLLMIINGAIAAFSLLAIFLYKNRSLQMRICRLNILLTSVLMVLLYFAADTLSSGMNQQIHFRYGAYLPFFVILFLFLANYNIRKDDELVRSADRLR